MAIGEPACNDAPSLERRRARSESRPRNTRDKPNQRPNSITDQPSSNSVIIKSKKSQPHRSNDHRRLEGGDRRADDARNVDSHSVGATIQIGPSGDENDIFDDGTDGRRMERLGQSSIDPPMILSLSNEHIQRETPPTMNLSMVGKQSDFNCNRSLPVNVTPPPPQLQEQSQPQQQSQPHLQAQQQPKQQQQQPHKSANAVAYATPSQMDVSDFDPMSSHRDLTFVSSLSSSSSNDDLSTVVDLKLDDDDHRDDAIFAEKNETELGEHETNSAMTSGFDLAVDTDDLLTGDGIDSRSQSISFGNPSEDSQGDDHDRKDGYRQVEDDDHDEVEHQHHHHLQNDRSQPSRCEDSESDESEFENDEILIVLRKKRKELIQKLWMIDEIINTRNDVDDEINDGGGGGT